MERRESAWPMVLVEFDLFSRAITRIDGPDVETDTALVVRAVAGTVAAVAHPTSMSGRGSG